MSWLTEYVRPKIRTLFARREVPDNLWHQCPACQQMIFHRDLMANLKVCPHCGHHMRAAAVERLGWTFDEGSFTRIELPKAVADPLRFRDTKRYTDRLKEARDKTHLEDAIVVAHGTIGGQRPSSRRWSSTSSAARWVPRSATGILAAARLAVLQDAPLIVFTASGGARMQEGAISLMQMPRTVIATRLVKEAGPAVHRRADRSHHRRRDRELRHARRHPDRRTRRADRLRRRPRDRADRAREAARGLPARRIPAGARHHRHGGQAHRAESDAGPPHRPAARQGIRPRHERARSKDIVARLHGLHPRLIDLSLDRLRALLAKLDHPERRLPPVIHVAGTNGKGSTCAFLRAMAEAAGQRVHVYTSPHLVRFNERIRVAGALVTTRAG